MGSYAYRWNCLCVGMKRGHLPTTEIAVNLPKTAENRYRRNFYLFFNLQRWKILHVFQPTSLRFFVVMPIYPYYNILKNHQNPLRLREVKMSKFVKIDAKNHTEVGLKL